MVGWLVIPASIASADCGYYPLLLLLIFIVLQAVLLLLQTLLTCLFLLLVQMEGRKSFRDTHFLPCVCLCVCIVLYSCRISLLQLTVNKDWSCITEHLNSSLSVKHMCLCMCVLVNYGVVVYFQGGNLSCR